MLGSRFGGHAEYVCIPQDGAITAKPRNMTFTDAVTLVSGGTTAHAFFSRTAIKLGSTVLVNGASGAVCTAAVQLAKQMGARVTGVCSGANRELVTALGADRVIDYTTEDFLLEGQTHDVIMDCVGNAPFERAAACLTPGGALLLVVSDLRGAASGRLAPGGAGGGSSRATSTAPRMPSRTWSTLPSRVCSWRSSIGRTT
ncbi:NAD(P)-dependent alcohol dehydrogenase [Cryobacterium sp. Sr3]|uniref:NAD(P)-dependent alcohol dehydrogenase n=1 Tax=Cryobacterium sp. Sr3 TaxID=1259194 RepID=UPI00106B5A36|nr:NAD(P)-dependent alcohol dehydrogenase [Cryobacterium sp. Sr3]TFB54520.1 NAD(P)-dependent alcohol dehydrogenase [Cryobacterium sp. Sr3]